MAAVKENDGQPLATIILVAYNQEAYVLDALQSIAGQTYGNLEVVVSDDASADGTFDRIQEFCAQYNGAHTFILNRNEANLGVGGNYAKAVSLSHGELIFVAGGDDISLPDRVSDVVDFWLERGKRLDLIACNLIDMTVDGTCLGEIQVADLGNYRTLEDWIAHPPHVIGAAQAWTRRLYDRFGGLPKGVVGEDFILSFRAIAMGTAATLPKPVVHYRRGGLTNKKKAISAEQVIVGLLKKTKSSYMEWSLLLRDAEVCGAGEGVLSYLHCRQQREACIEAMLLSGHPWKALFGFRGVDLAFRMRVFVYAVCPWVLAPLFFFKRIRYAGQV